MRSIGGTDSSIQALAHRVGRELAAEGVSRGDINRSATAVKVAAPDLRRVIIDEAIWYTRVGAIELRAAGRLATEGHFSLARSVAYYASFYFANALCRFAGRIPLYLREFAGPKIPGPTVSVCWDGVLPAHEFYVSRFLVDGNGSHVQTWSCFFKIWGTSPDISPNYLPAVTPPAILGSESFDRNDYTYRPWFGFGETASVADLEVARWKQAASYAFAEAAFSKDRFGTLRALSTDPILDVQARACLRGHLVLLILHSLGERSRAFKTASDLLRHDISAQMESFVESGPIANELRRTLAS